MITEDDKKYISKNAFAKDGELWVDLSENSDLFKKFRSNQSEFNDPENYPNTRFIEFSINPVGQMFCVESYDNGLVKFLCDYLDGSVSEFDKVSFEERFETIEVGKQKVMGRPNVFVTNK